MVETKVEGEGSAEVLQDAMLFPFVWTDGKDFQLGIHDFDNRIADVTDDWHCDDDAEEKDYFQAFFDCDVMSFIMTETTVIITTAS